MAAAAALYTYNAVIRKRPYGFLNGTAKLILVYNNNFP
jgi:hypothetical protein